MNVATMSAINAATMANANLMLMNANSGEPAQMPPGFEVFLFGVIAGAVLLFLYILWEGFR